MSNRQNKSKPMSMSDISKRMITRSQIREQSSTSVPNPPKVTNTEPTNITVDGYNGVQKTGTIPPTFDNTANTKTKIHEDKTTEVAEDKMADSVFQAQTPTFEESRLLNSNRTFREGKMIQMDRLPTMEIESDHKHFYHNSNTIDQIKSDEVKQPDYRFEHQKMKQLLQESEEKIRRQQAEEEIRKMAEKIYENNKMLENNRAAQNFRYHDNYMPHQADINQHINKINNHHDDFIPNQTNYNTNIDRNDFYRSIHDQEMVSDRLLKKFKRIETVKNPRDVLSYFQEEFHRLSIHDDHCKYNILVEKWPREDVTNYYKLIDRNNRNFHSFCDFCVNRDDSLSDILSKKPQYDGSTPFGVFLAEATKWARSDENDRIKYFCWQLAPDALKLKIRENFNESYENFRKKVQAIWNCQDEKPLPNPVNYDRTQRNDQTQSNKYPRRYNNRNFEHKNNGFNRNNYNHNRNYNNYNNNNSYNNQQQNRTSNTNNPGELCFNHRTYGEGAWSCIGDTCPMAHLTTPRPQQGNAFPSSRQ